MNNHVHTNLAFKTFSSIYSHSYYCWE